MSKPELMENGYYKAVCDVDGCNVYYTDRLSDSVGRLIRWHLKHDHQIEAVQYGHKPSECATVHPYSGHFEWADSVVQCEYIIGNEPCQIPATNRLHRDFLTGLEEVNVCPEHFKVAWLMSEERKTLEQEME